MAVLLNQNAHKSNIVCYGSPLKSNIGMGRMSGGAVKALLHCNCPW